MRVKKTGKEVSKVMSHIPIMLTYYSVCRVGRMALKVKLELPPSCCRPPPTKQVSLPTFVGMCLNSHELHRLIPLDISVCHGKPHL